MKISAILTSARSGAVLLFLAALPITAATQTTKTNNLKEYAVGACLIRIESEMFGGNFEVHDEGTPAVGIFTFPDASSKNSVGLSNGFTLFCVDASDEKIDTMLNARQVNGKWFTYNPWPGPDEPEWKPFDQGAHARTVQFKGSNWRGTGLTVDATTGDEKSRARTFYFCLVHQTHALCGKSPVQWLADPGKRNELWKIRAILQSIEFVDTPPSVEPSPSSGSASSPKL